MNTHCFSFRMELLGRCFLGGDAVASHVVDEHPVSPHFKNHILVSPSPVPPLTLCSHQILATQYIPCGSGTHRCRDRFHSLCPHSCLWYSRYTPDCTVSNSEEETRRVCLVRKVKHHRLKSFLSFLIKKKA